MTQPFLHDLSIALSAPVQVWSRFDGQVEPLGAQGVYVSDERVVSSVTVDVVGRVVEHVATSEPGGGLAEFRAIVRTPELGIDHAVVLVRRREVTAGGVRESLTLRTSATTAQHVDVSVVLAPDHTPMADIKAGMLPVPVPTAEPADGVVEWQWRDADTSASLRVDGGSLTALDGSYRVAWAAEVPARGEATLVWELSLDDRGTPFVATTADGVPVPRPAGATPSLQRLLDKGIADLNALRLADREHPGEAFFAAGSPWFLTLFGRDSLISARLALPADPSPAVSTLRVLARRQGVAADVTTAEQPGKMLHEVRRVTLDMHEERDGRAVALPPEYFGTIDATLLWILVLGDLHRAGHDVAEFVPALRGALGWLRDHADADGDGFLEYFDESGTGLSNQGWKDSGDSIRWADGTQAEGPIALVEVQGYAHEAALVGAAILEEQGAADEAAQWREYADAMRERFRAAFWVSDDLGRYPALALDVHKQPVTGVSSNIGHLLGTGILDEDETRVVVERLVHPTMASGHGVRTLSTTNGGYWPLGYHVGSVWTHDTAVIVDGMLREGYADEAADLAAQLLRAAEGVNYRLPELFGGQSADECFPPVPYPASCRPQAWAAASAITVARALGGLDA